jgi:predicted  nucleic acid-binding Zn-ribbon protein
MKNRAAIVWAIFVLSVWSAHAEPRRDPLTPPEVNQLRDTAQEPELRLKLYVKFARARLDTLDKARTDPQISNHAQAVHDHLQDFLDLYDELNDNVDTYADRRADLRKVLKTVIEADTEFGAKLRALKDQAGAEKENVREYEFLLTNALETLDSSAQDHRQLLAEQEELAKQKKLVKPEAQQRGR